MGPRSALCASTAATDRQDDLTAGLGGEALGQKWGLPTTGTAAEWCLGAGLPSSVSHTSHKRAAGGARLDWRWQGRAGWSWALVLGLMDAPQEAQPRAAAARTCPVLCRRATLSTDCGHAPVGRQGRVPRLGKWAGGTLGRKSLLQTGGSSSSGVQLETWARGVGRLGRQLGGLAEGCTSLPPFFTLFPEYDRRNFIHRRKRGLRPSRQKPSRTLALMENTANKRSSLRVIAPRCQRQGCDETDWLPLPSRQAPDANKQWTGKRSECIGQAL